MATDSFVITVDAQPVIQMLDNLARKQLPYAFSKSINSVAYGSQKEVVQDVPKKFTVRTSWSVPGNKHGFNVKKSTKQMLEAAIYTRAPWMKLHETGGIKTPKGQHLAIPTSNVRPKGSKLVLKKSRRPKYLLKHGAFLAGQGKRYGIYMRVSSVLRYPIMRMFSLVPSGVIKEQLDMMKTVQSTVNKTWAETFNKNWEEALRTAK